MRDFRKFSPKGMGPTERYCWGGWMSAWVSLLGGIALILVGIVGAVLEKSAAPLLIVGCGLLLGSFGVWFVYNINKLWVEYEAKVREEGCELWRS